MECRPILAICAHHRCGLIKAANPEYHVFLRRYPEDCWETVYYPILPERLVARAA
jgi:hypothetical protein